MCVLILVLSSLFFILSAVTWPVYCYIMNEDLKFQFHYHKLVLYTEKSQEVMLLLTSPVPEMLDYAIT